MESSCPASEDSPSRGPALAKPLAPEDVRIGDYVALLDVTVQWPSWYWCCDPAVGDDRAAVVRMRCLPASERQVPLKVLAVCLPLVLVTSPSGEVQTLDVRQLRVARLSKRYARKAWKALRPKRRSSKSSRRG